MGESAPCADGALMRQTLNWEKEHGEDQRNRSPWFLLTRMRRSTMATEWKCI